MITRNLPWRLSSRIRRSDTQRHYDEIRSIITREKLLGLQERYLRSLLLHVHYNVPYYSQIFNEIGLIKKDAVDLSQFVRIPILTKEIIRKHHEELISKDYKSRKWYYNSSGGSTGEPVRFIQDDIYGRWRNATNNYYYQDMLGINELKAKKVILWGSERDLFEGSIGLKGKIANWLTNTVFLNSFRMTLEDVGKYLFTKSLVWRR